MKTLSSRLQHALFVRGKSAAELARAVKKTESAVSQWVSGETKAMRGDSLMAVCSFLSCQPSWLASGVGASGLNSLETEAPAPQSGSTPPGDKPAAIAATAPEAVAPSPEAIMLGTMLDTIKEPLRRLEVMSACVNLIVLAAPQTAPKSPPALADAARMSDAKSPA